MYLTFLFWLFFCKQIEICFFAIKDTLFIMSIHLAFFVTERMENLLGILQALENIKKWLLMSQNWDILFLKSQFGTIFVFQNMPIQIFLLMKKKACLIDIKVSFLKSTTVQVTLSFLFCCFYVCCLRYLA